MPLSMRFIKTCCSCTRSAVVRRKPQVEFGADRNRVPIRRIAQQNGHLSNDFVQVDQFPVLAYLARKVSELGR